MIVFASGRMRLIGAVGLAVCLAVLPAKTVAALSPTETAQIAFRQHPGRQLPLETGFVDENGVPVRLARYFPARPALPVIVVPGYFRCEMLCMGVSDGLIRALQGMGKVAGRDFRVVYVSIDPAETAEAATARKEAWLRRYGRSDAGPGCVYLRGTPGAVARFAEQIGFEYRADPQTHQFAHPAGFLVATPEGTISRYFLGVSFSAGELERALADAGRQKIATEAPAPGAALLCFRAVASAAARLVMGAMRLIALGTAVGLGVLIYRANQTHRANRSRCLAGDERE